MFADIASEMLYPIIPVYLRNIGFSVLLIGILEGVAEATAGLSKGYFGNWSDNIGNRLWTNNGVDSVYYQYNATGIPNRLTSFGFDNIHKTDYTYNGYGSVSQILKQDSIGNSWVDVRKEQFFFTPGGFMKKFLKFNIQNEFSNVNCGGATGVMTRDTAKWDWRYRYSPFGTREQKRLYFSPHGDSCTYLHPWVYYLQGAGGEQLAVYHGVQTADPKPMESGRRVLMYPSQYLTNGGELSYNLNGINGTTKDYQITDHLGNVRAVLTLKVSDSTKTMSSYDYKPFGDTLNTTSGKELRLGYNGRERDYENNYFSFGARNYDSETGRFLSVDPFFEAFPNQTPYQYAYNSPIQFKDPSGLAPEEEKKERVLAYKDLVHLGYVINCNTLNGGNPTSGIIGLNGGVLMLFTSWKIVDENGNPIDRFMLNRISNYNSANGIIQTFSFLQMSWFAGTFSFTLVSVRYDEGMTQSGAITRDDIQNKISNSYFFLHNFIKLHFIFPN
ncbi:hypothetical protein D9V86_03155 [Bacteroidetes/Chlorobi group bacterium ChocPot_Mid]|nr:MAG: hypothetical protein D9V86_03155 [Bacteroidetes/Chlorobi group bacterium ChocPot_Mid]